MQQFTIRQIEQLSGIKAPTLRIWEKRYNLISPGRSDGRQRIYTNEDLRSILKVVYLYRKGIRISRIASLKEQQLLKELTVTGQRNDNFAALIILLMEAAIGLDEAGVERIFDSVEKEHGFEGLVLQLIYPFLEMLGQAWVTGKVLPGNEHFISHIVTRKLLLAIEGLSHSYSKSNTVLLFQPAGELHELPLLFMNYLFKKHGWQTFYFGNNVEIGTLKAFIDNKPVVTHLYYHPLTHLTSETPDNYLQKLSAAFPKQIIVAGGSFMKKVKATGSNTLLLLKEEDIYRFVGNG